MTKAELEDKLIELCQEYAEEKGWAQTNALCYKMDRVELKTLWVGKEKKTVILFHGKHVPLC